MDIKFDIDLSLLDERAKNFEKNLAFSVAQALRETALTIQKKIRLHIAKAFKLRKSSSYNQYWILDQIKITTWPNVRQNRPYAVIQVNDKNKGRALLLGTFEEGGTKGPALGRHIAVPITGGAARPSWEQSVNTRKYGFAALNFQQKTYGQLGADSWKGRKRAAHPRKPKPPGPHAAESVWVGRSGAFMLPKTGRSAYGGVYQRTEAGRDGIKMLYSFRPSAALKKSLGFIDTARATYAADFQEEFYRRFLHIPRG